MVDTLDNDPFAIPRQLTNARWGMLACFCQLLYSVKKHWLEIHIRRQAVVKDADVS